MKRYNEALSDRGKLTKSLRVEAKRAFVFVTDDEAKGIGSTKFLAGSKVTFLPGDHATVFSFVPKSPALAAGCAANSENLPAGYGKMATATGGATFEFCKPDWRANFTKLSEKVSAVVKDTYPLADGVLSGSMQDIEIEYEL